MININDREWNDLTIEDVEKTISDQEESFFFEFKEDGVETKKLSEEISAFAIHMVDIFLWGFLMKKLLLDVKNGMNKRFIL